MPGSLDQPPITVQAKRKRGVPSLVLGLLLLFGGAPMLMGGARSAPLGMVLFALGLLAVFLAVMMIAAPARLVVGPEGIKLTGLLRTRTFGWDQAANFRVVRLRRTRLIGYDKPGLGGGRGLLSDLAAAISTVNLAGPYDAVLPGAWSTMSAEGVAELLNEGRARWGGVLAARAPALRARGSSGQRIDRKLYWLALALLTGLGVLLGAATPGGHLFTRGLLLFWIWVYARRLHDFGRSGWWQAAGLALQVVLAYGLIGQLHWRESPSLAVLGLVQLVFTGVVGAIPGDPGENRFGPPPGVPPLAAQAEVFR